MKRFHVHVAVPDIDKAIAFYSRLFGVEPTVRKPDYAKWMVEDPRLNFAISKRGTKAGLNHLGFQLDSDEEFQAMHAQLMDADAGLVEEIGANCCYARSDKYWVTDPVGIAWETYHTLGSIPLFGSEDTAEACCEPEVTTTATGLGCGTDTTRVRATIPVTTPTKCCA
jgi:catechol 2,3-dioxygenase-like lactoylglutathione lyase family enzyme